MWLGLANEELVTVAPISGGVIVGVIIIKIKPRNHLPSFEVTLAHISLRQLTLAFAAGLERSGKTVRQHAFVM